MNLILRGLNYPITSICIYTSTQNTGKCQIWIIDYESDI